MQLGCPECQSVEFSTTERLLGVSGFVLDGANDIRWFDTDVMWDTAETDYIECSNCGWGADVSHGEPIINLLSPALGDEEDLPDKDY